MLLSTMAEFNAQKVTKVSKSAAVDPDTSFRVEGTDGGTFAIASSKKELKQLMKSDADVVYDERKGKLYFNDNGTKELEDYSQIESWWSISNHTT